MQFIRKLTTVFAVIIFAALIIPQIAHADTPIEKRIKIDLPKGAGPFPAVILMHWTGGPGAAERTWAKRLNANGIAAITLKSYSRISGGFDSFERRVPERITHLKQAFAFAKSQPWGNGKISVLGRSHGA